MSAEKPKVIFYNISEYSNNVSNPGTISNLTFTLSRINYVGLQKIESDEETRLNYIDEDIHFLPLDPNFIKVFNKIYLNKNEMYTEIDTNNTLHYTKITDKKMSSIIINPYNSSKMLIEFMNTKGIFPYNFSQINIPELECYLIKMMILKNNDVIYDENLSLSLQSYDLKLNIAVKKNDKLHFRIINLSDMSNLHMEDIKFTIS